MIPEAHTLWLFLLASLAALVTPGPAVAYIVTRSVMDGARWFTGSVFIALGLGTAISGEPHRG